LLLRAVHVGDCGAACCEGRRAEEAGEEAEGEEHAEVLRVDCG
jgi:hypothetical protein